MEKEKVEETELKVTDGGHSYIEKDGLKVRSAMVNHRLKDDGETFEEYKMRQKFMKSYVKRKAKGTHLWFGGRGTYVKAEVEAYIRAELERKKAENG
jgi:hypothetical protein